MQTQPSQVGVTEDLVDSESQVSLNLLVQHEKIRAEKLSGIKIVLVMLSSRGMVYDVDSLRQKILLTYPEAAVFFQATVGKPLGAVAPQQVDLLIDFTGPGQRQGLFAALKLRRKARFAVGRNAGLWRNRVYDRVYNEKTKMVALPKDLLARERRVQQEVLKLAGISVAPHGEVLEDRGQTIALELPSMARL